MYGVDGNRPINFDRHSLPDYQTGCGGAGGGAGSGETHDCFAGATRKASPFDEVSGNHLLLSSHMSRPDGGSGIDPEVRDVLRKLIGWLSDGRKTEGPEPVSTVAPETVLTRKVDPASTSTERVETQTEKTELPKRGEVIVVDEPIVVDGGVFDGKGATYTASSRLGDGGQAEGQSPIFILRNGATLRNVNIGENGADGIHVYNGATVENVHWLDVGEDALTVKSGGDVNIIGGSAKGASDKIFQVNADAHIYIKDFQADGFSSLVRTNGGKQLDVDVVIDGGSFANGGNLFRTDSSLAGVSFQSDISLSNVKNWTRVGDQQSGV